MTPNSVVVFGIIFAVVCGFVGGYCIGRVHEYILSERKIFDGANENDEKEDS